MTFNPRGCIDCEKATSGRCLFHSVWTTTITTKSYASGGNDPGYVEPSVIGAVVSAYQKAVTKHPPMNSPHEGWAVIKEELDELWEHVMRDTGRSADAAKEALQIAAMGMRYYIDLCGK